MPFLNETNLKIKKDFPRRRPENQVPLYLESLQQSKSIRREPNWDAPPKNTTLEIAKAQAKLQAVEAKLKKVQAEKESKQRVLDLQWADLEQKEEGFRKAFIQFNEFLKENAEKRQRCKMKMQMDDTIIKNREKQMEILQKEYDDMFGVKQQMEDTIKKHEVYENFLRTVVESSSNLFAHPMDFLKRHDVLMQAREQTLNRQEQAISNLESAYANIKHLIDVKSESIRIFSNKVAMMLSRYEEAKKKSLFYEKMLENMREHMNKSSQGISSVKTAAWNLYGEMSQRTGEKMKFKKWDIENHLMYIKRRLKIMENIAASATTITVKPKKRTKVTVVKPDEPIYVKTIWRRSISTEEESKTSSSTSTLRSTYSLYKS